MASLFVNLPAPAANGSGAAVDVSTFGATKTFIISGTWILEPLVTIEFNNASSSSDGSWQAIQTTPGAGQFTVDVACKWLRVTVQSYKEGMAPVVNVGGTDAGTTLANLPAPAGIGSGTPVDTSALPSFKTIQVAGVFRGTCLVEISTDGGTTYGQVASFDQPGVYSGVFDADFMRVSRVGVPGVSPGIPVVNVGASSTAGGGGGGGGGIDLENNGTPVVGGPFTTLDLIGATAADAGGGTATVTVTGGGNPQSFQYTVTGLEPDLTEITIALPVARANATYQVQVSWANWTALIQLGIDNASRTTNLFVLSLAAPASTGDVFSFYVRDL